MIFGAWSELPLRTIERELLERNIANPENLKVLDRAAVSTAKLTPTTAQCALWFK